MGVNIHNLIAAINPDIYCDKSLRSEVKSIAKKSGYLEAAKKAKPVESETLNWKEVDYIDPFKKFGLKYPTEKFSIHYDAAGASLEPIYFWLINVMNIRYKRKVDKLVDNFVSSPGSAHFSEMGAKATKMQEEGMKILGAVNQVVKSVLNLIYDLKEFKLRLATYKEYRSKEKIKRDNALLSLKQIWMDNVDIKRGNTSIKAMAQQFDYVTLIDAFVSAESEAHAEKLDLNERVKRIIKPRVAEFFRWIAESEKELNRRFELEKMYLKSQLNTIKLYARWAKPYLKSAKLLEQNASPSIYLVNMFNTTLFELTLLGYARHKVEEDVWAGWLSKDFLKLKFRPCNFVGIAELKFISAPERISQQGAYGFRGRLQAEFTSYALNNDEIETLKREMEKDDLGDIFRAMEGATDESIYQIETDIEEIIGSDTKEETEEIENRQMSERADINPFAALFWFLKSKKDEKKDNKSKKTEEIKQDSEIEKVVRSLASLKARKECKKVYDAYKKSNDLPTTPAYG